MYIDPFVLIGAIVTVLTSVIGAGIKKVWVWGWNLTDKEKALTDMTDDRDFWRDIALASMGHTETALDVASAAAARKRLPPKGANK